MISLILSESALELVPSELKHHPSVISHARKLGKLPSEILLDNSWHFAAMKGMINEIKRGRPDLVHFSILEATTIPLYLKNKMNLFVHTIDDKVIYFSPNVHVPKSYHRFVGLIEKLFSEKIVEADGKNLLEIKNMTFEKLIQEIKPKRIIGLSAKGIPSTCENIAQKLTDDSCIVIGGFPKGHFSDEIKKRFEYTVNVGLTSLEAHVIISRVLYEYEKTIFM